MLWGPTPRPVLYSRDARICFAAIKLPVLVAALKICTTQPTTRKYAVQLRPWVDA